jgi:hypothetical protein
MRTTASVLASLFIPTMCGCVATVRRDDYLARTLAPRAAFDLGCPADHIEFINLSHPMRRGSFWPDGDHSVQIKEDMSSQQGAQGCGRRASYVQVRGEWVADAIQGNKP